MYLPCCSHLHPPLQFLVHHSTIIAECKVKLCITISACNDHQLTLSTVYTQNGIHCIQHSPQHWLSSVDFHYYEWTPKFIFSILYSSLQIGHHHHHLSALHEGSQERSICYSPTVASSLTEGWSLTTHCPSESTSSRSTTSMYLFNLTPQWHPNISPHLLTQDLVVHFYIYSILASKCISKLNQ